jgi:hypothetical protein
MPTFPFLKSGALAQHPVARSVARRTKVIEFIDGQEQRFRLTGRDRHRWVIDLAALTDEETETLRQFFSEVEGPAGTFTFVDPLSGTEYSNCRFGHESLEINTSQPGQSRVTIIIRER